MMCRLIVGVSGAALSYGSILTRNEHRQYKRQKLTRKTKDIELVLQSRVSLFDPFALSRPLPYDPLPPLFSVQPSHDRARRKQLKYLQREVSFVTHNADPFAHVLQARAQLLARAHLAYYRMLKRQEVRWPQAVATHRAAAHGLTACGVIVVCAAVARPANR